MVLTASLVQKTCYDNLPMLKRKDPEIPDLSIITDIFYVPDF